MEFTKKDNVEFEAIYDTTSPESASTQASYGGSYLQVVNNLPGFHQPPTWMEVNISVNAGGNTSSLKVSGYKSMVKQTVTAWLNNVVYENEEF